MGAHSAIEVRCETPYPAELEWGVIEGFCHTGRFGTPDRSDVLFVPGDNVTHSCTVTVRKLT